MQEIDCPEDNPRLSVLETVKDQRLTTRYTSNQFYPKSKSKPKNVQLNHNSKPKAVLLNLADTSAFSQPYVENLSHISGPIQTFNPPLPDYPSPGPRQHSSFTMKILQSELKNNSLLIKQSLQIGGKSPQKFRAKIYEQIEMYHNSEYRVRHMIGATSQLSSSLRKQKQQSLRNRPSLNMNYENKAESDHNRETSSLYQSLPQPFVNKKQLVSFDSSLNYFKSRQQKKQQQRNKLTQTKNKELKLLEINNLKQSHYFNKNHQLQHKQQLTNMIQEMTKFSNDYNLIMQSAINKKNKYKKKKLQPLKVNGVRDKMSNNIKDYLSVERIKIKQIENHLLAQTANTLSENQKGSVLSIEKDANKESQTQVSTQSPTKPASRKSVKKPYSTVGAIPKAKPVKFVPPFNLYYFRDFIWKIGFSNQFLVEIPQQYNSKIKVYIGKGNNSNLIRGFIKRRPWYQTTQKYQEAHFVWTQIKIQQYFALQKKTQKQLQYQPIDSQLAKETKHITLNQTLNELQKVKFNSYWTKNFTREMKFKDSLKARSKMMNLKQVPLNQVTQNIKIHNHFVNNYVIGNKKALFSLMSSYYQQIGEQPFNFLPLTFHIKNGLEDDQYLKFLNNFYSISKEIKKMQDSELNSYIYKHNAWIVKPGENTNRGNGIIVCLTLNEIKAILKKKQKHNDGTNKTYILQKYIEKPLLYKKRKFDLRHYMMMSCMNGIVKGYWYKQGYVRTTSAEYTLKFSSESVHLTNDAVQKQLPDYGKFEKGNKISYEELNQYIKKADAGFDFNTIILPKMKKIATDLITASGRLMDPSKRENNFEIFGLDFMIDEAYNVWLIECNSNPCLELSCPLLGKIIPKMVQNTFRICLDPVFVPPLSFAPKSQEYYENINETNSFQLVYDERNDKNISKQVQNNDLLENKDFQEDDDTFDDDGEELDD